MKICGTLNRLFIASRKSYAVAHVHHILRSYLVVVSDVSDDSAEVLDSEVDIIVHLFVHSVIRRIWVSEEEREKKEEEKKRLTKQNL